MKKRMIVVGKRGPWAQCDHGNGADCPICVRRSGQCGVGSCDADATRCLEIARDGRTVERRPICGRWECMEIARQGAAGDGVVLTVTRDRHVT